MRISKHLNHKEVREAYGQFVRDRRKGDKDFNAWLRKTLPWNFVIQVRITVNALSELKKALHAYKQNL